MISLLYKYSYLLTYLLTIITPATWSINSKYYIGKNCFSVFLMFMSQICKQQKLQNYNHETYALGYTFKSGN